MSLSQSLPAIQKKIAEIMENMQKVIVGKEEAVRLILVALLCRGHVLIEDVPGVGKTVLVHALARSADLSFGRIQCTSDLLPADVTGFTVFDAKTSEKQVHFGPVMNQLLLADEINRTSPKTQSGLLEAMDERRVSIDGETYDLPRPFMVLATQNPIESVGTFPLPEAQMDRFLLKISLGYPTVEEEMLILERFSGAQPLDTLQPVANRQEILALQEAVEQVSVSDAMRHYVVELVSHTRQSEWVRLGASPRAGLALISAAKAHALMQGFDFVRPEDVQAVAVAVLAHRLLLSSPGKLQGWSGRSVVEQLVARIPVPLER